MKGGRGTSEMARRAAISQCASAFVTHGIIIADKDAMFVGEIFQGFCTGRNVALQAVIRGIRQSLGGAGRRHGLFRGIV